MLTELHIENLAVIENVTVQLGPRLNVFTGETGAGKSILIGGINAILGQRVSRDIVRSGAEKAFVSAVFKDVPERVRQKLAEIGIEPEDELIISREITKDGKSTARINSRPVSAAALRDIGGELINIHGQHDSQALLDPSRHLSLLDGYAGTEEVLSDYLKDFRRLQKTARKISELSQIESDKLRRREYLESVASDIEPLKIEPDEDASVEERFKILDNSVELKKSLTKASALLTGDDESDGAEGMVASAINELSAGESVMSVLTPLIERLNSLLIELSDISGECSRLSFSLEVDSGEYEKLSVRRDELARIKRRYGPTLGDVMELYERSVRELKEITDSREVLKALNKEKEQLLAIVSKKAERLHNLREKAAENFKEQVESELRFLNMPDVKIEMSLKKGKLTGSGMDTAELLISPNRGEELKPVAKIASGGELSRIMLALKSVLAGRDSVPTMIFDEIDAGVSGRAAQKIGVKLREISREKQVLCVTHLAQIAIIGDTHILINKSTEGERTVTTVKQLDFEGRRLEIARILGGDNITQTVLKDAEEQLLGALMED